MGLDGILLNKVVEDLNTYIPMRVNKIYSINKSEFLFYVKTFRENKILLISTNAKSNRIHFSERHFKHEDHPDNFTMLLRKHLLNAMITSIEQKEYDRFIKITLENFNSIGDKVKFYIYLELFGRFSNFIFCDSDDKILDASKRISPIENPNAAIIPGATYKTLSSQDKKDPFKDQSFDINRSLVKQFSGFSPILDKEVRYRIEKGENFKEIMDEIKASKKLVVSESDKKVDFHTIPFLHFKKSSKSYSLHTGFDKLFYEKDLKRQIDNKTRNLRKFINRELKKQKKKVVRLKEQYQKNKMAKENLKFADLIITYQNKISKGMDFVNVYDWESEEDISIPLDKKLDAIRNAQKYYKKYNKQKKSIKYLKEQIEKAKEEIKYFSQLSEQIEIADIDSAKEIRNELIENKYIFDKKKKKKKRKKKKPKFTVINFDENTVIRLGKNNLQNDYITFKASRKSDYWFHVENYHGAHVTVSTNELSNEKIELAANLAAYFSKARASKNIAVNYTQVKNIKKIPGAKAGMVKIDDYQTVFITVDEQLIDEYIK